MAKTKVNPKKIPRSQRDVDDAYRLGTYKGTEVTLILLLQSACDLGADDDGVDALWDKFIYNLDSMHKGYIKLYDVKNALEDEYGIKFESLLKHFGVKSRF